MNSTWRTHDVAVGGDMVGGREREWVITNGTGAYAMGTLPGVNTRRYHGLLVAATHPPVGRVAALNQVFEQIVRSDDASGKPVAEFGSCLFRDGQGQEVTAPRGVDCLQRFEKGLGVSWTYEAAGLRVTRSLHLHWKEQAATIRYAVEVLGGDEATERRSDEGAGTRHPTPDTRSSLPRPQTRDPRPGLVLRVFPMLTLRDFHGMRHQGDAGGFGVEKKDQGTVTVRRDGAVVTLRLAGARWFDGPNWWTGLWYPAETARGQEDREDYFVPGGFDVPLGGAGRTEVQLTVALGETAAEARDGSDSRRAAHLEPIAAAIAQRVGERLGPNGAVSRSRMLAIAADDFVVDRRLKGQTLSTIIAGYPWFADWGRDTFISLPGLLLETGRFEEARGVLRVFAGAIRGGMVPNHFDDYNDTAAHYNNVDGSLWFIHAAMAYAQASGDQKTWQEVLEPAGMAIIEAYIRGTGTAEECFVAPAGQGPMIRMAGDGLITAGTEQTQLTWMDAACGAPGSPERVVFTPRCGKAVEINALWHHVLAGMAEMVKSRHAAAAAHYEKLTGRIRRSFLRVFWDEDRQCLLDHVKVGPDGQEKPDRLLRPNQIFACSLEHSPLPLSKQKLVVASVRDHLLTPVGLRTLAPGEPGYHGHYRGSPMERDGAYHQGTAWPWLIGAYAEAVLRVGKFSSAARAEARAAIEPLLSIMSKQGLGQLHEIHDADLPHHPGGCVAQAWSVAEVVRVLGMIEGKGEKR